MCANSIWRRAKKKRDIFFVLFFLSTGSFFPRRVRHLETMPHTHTHKSGSFSSSWSLATLLSADLRVESIATAGRQNIPDRKHIAERKKRKKKKTLDMFKTLLLSDVIHLSLVQSGEEGLESKLNWYISYINVHFEGVFFSDVEENENKGRPPCGENNHDICSDRNQWAKNVRPQDTMDCVCVCRGRSFGWTSASLFSLGTISPTSICSLDV